jgi:peptidoglycan/xylan/chitin deacetylase (PgdA/CDA1 family)
MVGGLPASIRFVLSLVFGATASVMAAVNASASAWAEACPGNPDALGTSRILVVDPGQFSRIGLMQYPQSLPLADKEVVLTFDDGPLPRYSNPILDILAAQCVKATYFLIGSMAREFPATVRRMREAGHTIGTHSENHPSRMNRLPIDKVRAEIDQGIADVGAALWDARDLAPFFRIPGLNRSDAIEAELASRSLVVFSSDTVADDWHRRIRPVDIVRLAMSRLEARGRGILLLHDIHATTVAALPELLKRLKEEGFHIVHVVPGSAAQIAVAAAPPRGAASEAAHEPPDDAPHQLPNGPPREATSETLHELQSDQPTDVAGEPQLQMPGDQPHDMADNGSREIAGLETRHETANDLPPLDRNDPEWPAPDGAPVADDIALPAPDLNAFAAGYRPWHVVILADGSASATSLALGAVTQWSDPPTTPATADPPQLPAPAMPVYFGGGETVTSIAE